MAHLGESLSTILHDFERSTKVPESYISCQPRHEASVTACTKSLFDLAASHAEEHITSSNPLSELITEGFDEEQIWQELELQNQPFIASLVRRVAKSVAGRNRLHLCDPAMQELNEEEGEEDEDDEILESEDDVKLDDSEDDAELDDNEDRVDVQRTKQRTNRGKTNKMDSDDSDESDTNFDINDLHSRTKQKKKASKQSEPIQGKNEVTKSSVVDDMFFKMDDMERFLEMEDAKEAKRVSQMDGKGKGDESEDDEEEDEAMDYFDDASSGDEGFDDDDHSDDDAKNKKSTRDLMYSDFFNDPGAQMTSKPKKKKVHFQQPDEEEEEEMEEGDKDFEEESFEDADEDLLAGLRETAAAKNKDDLLLSNSESEGEEMGDILGGSKKGKDPSSKSSYEKRQEKLKQKINELEQSNVAVKSWQLIGEVAGGRRPENSLLEETLEFDVTTRPAPVITEETTQTLEGMIRQRILDQAWDSVQRKAKPKEEAFEFKKRVTLDQEKSKMSLGEIYEQEYIKQTQQEAEEEKEEPLQADIKESMDALFVKLDALSNFHFTPKPIAPELKIVSNTPAISMEEVTPVNVAESSLLAPEEIQEREKGELKGKTEKTSTDRNRDLRKKKQRQRAKAKNRERKERLVEKLKPGLGNKYSKKAALARLEKSSKGPSSNTTILKDVDNAKGNFKSSKAFFSKLQEEVVAEVRGLKQKKKKTKQISGTQLKL